MDNFELHEKAQELADSETAYNLARRVVELESREILAERLPNGEIKMSGVKISESDKILDHIIELEEKYKIDGEDAGFKNDMKAKFIMEQNNPYKLAKEVVRLGNLIQSFDTNKEWLHVHDMRPNNGDLVAITDSLDMKLHHELLGCELCVYQDGEFWTSPPDGDESIPFNLNVDYWWKLIHRA